MRPRPRSAPPTARRRGTACWRRCRRSRSSSGRRGPRSRSSTRPASPSAARGVAGPGWALLPSAAGVIDPLLSTGFPLTLLGILRLVDLLERTSPGPERDAALARVRAARRWRSWTRPSASSRRCTRRWTIRRCSSGSACSISRRPASARRRAGSGGPELAPGFLLCAHPAFGPELAACARRGRRAPRRRAARARGAHRPRDRAVRHRRPARSPTPGLVSRPRRGPPGVGATSCAPRRPRSSVFSSAAAWCRASRQRAIVCAAPAS